jgi:hypothetical protein
MVRYFILLLLVLSCKVRAEGSDVIVDYSVMTPVKVNMLFSMMNVFDSNTLPNFVEREKRRVGCVENYIESQSKSYAKFV